MKNKEYSNLAISSIFEKTRGYRILCSSLRVYSAKLFSITEQELHYIIEYDVLIIMASYYSRVNEAQKKTLIKTIESEMALHDSETVLDNLSDFMDDNLFVPYLLKLLNRTGKRYRVEAAYEVLFKYCAKIISAINDGFYTKEYTLLMNVAYFFVLAKGLGFLRTYSAYMDSCYGQRSYDDLVEFLYKKNSKNTDWDDDIDLNEIETFIESDHDIKLIHDDNYQELHVDEYLDVIDISAAFHGIDFKEIRIKNNIESCSEIRRKTGLRKRWQDIIEGFDCQLYVTENNREEYVIVFQRAESFRLLIYDESIRKEFLNKVYKNIQAVNTGIDSVYLIYIKNSIDDAYPTQCLTDDTSFCPILVFSIDEAIPFLLNRNNKLSKNTLYYEKDSIHQQTNFANEVGNVEDKWVQETWKEDDEYGLFVIENGWIYDEIYVPYIKVIVINHSQDYSTNHTIKAVFYERGNRNLWAEDKDSIIDTDNGLLSGLMHVCFFKSDQGYRSQISEISLPNIYADILIDDVLWGQVIINKTYEQTKNLEPIFKDYIPIIDSPYVRKTNMPFYPVVKVTYWKESDDLFVPFLKVDVINQEEAPAECICIKAVFYYVENKNLWSVVSQFIVEEDNTPLKQGYCKTAFLKASKGCLEKIEDAILPDVEVEIYINDLFYGKTRVAGSYQPIVSNISLNEEPVSIENDYVRFDQKKFHPIVKQKHWIKCSNIYTPYLQLDITNQLENPVYELFVEVYFFDKSDDTLFCQGEDCVLSGNVPLRSGFNMTAFVRGQRGYEDMVEEEQLPDIIAYVYINDDYYGFVELNKTYDAILVTENLLSGKDEKQNKDSNVWNTKSFLGEMGYSTNKTQNERHVILTRAIRQYGKQRIIDHISFLIRMRMMQVNGAEKYQKAISNWKEDLIFVRKQ